MVHSNTVGCIIWSTTGHFSTCDEILGVLGHEWLGGTTRMARDVLSCQTGGGVRDTGNWLDLNLSVGKPGGRGKNDRGEKKNIIPPVQATTTSCLLR